MKARDLTLADQTVNDKKNESFDKKDRNDWGTTESDFLEESAAEVTPRLGGFDRDTVNISPENERPENVTEEGTGGRTMGAIALALSILSLFFLPVLMGAAGIIVGFIARRRGANGLGNWAIGIGAVSMIIALFIAPFFY